MTTSRRAGGRAALCALAGAVAAVVAPSATASPFSQQRLQVHASAPSAPVIVQLSPRASAQPDMIEPPELVDNDPPLIDVGSPLSQALQGSDDPWPVEPPDQALAVGQDDVLQLVNAVGRIWHHGDPGAVFPLAQLFATGSDALRHPWALYDAATNRFFAGIFDVPLGGEVIAVSETSSPATTGSSTAFPGRARAAPARTTGAPASAATSSR